MPVTLHAKSDKFGASCQRVFKKMLWGKAFAVATMVWYCLCSHNISPHKFFFVSQKFWSNSSVAPFSAMETQYLLFLIISDYGFSVNLLLCGRHRND